MKTRLLRLFVYAALSLFATVSSGEIVEEEVWYGADGKVVKRVKRTYTGADRPGGTSDWEPSWVAREREQAKRLASSGRKSARSRYSTSSKYYGGGPYFYSYGPSRYYGWRAQRCYVPYRHGFTGWHARAGGGRLIINYSN